MTNLTVFAVLLKDVPMGWKDAVVPKPRLKNHTISCPTYERHTRLPYSDNLCRFCALSALHLHKNQRLEEETPKSLNLFINRTDGLSPNQIPVVQINDIPVVEDLLTLNILLHDIYIVDGNIIAGSAGRNVLKYENTL